MTRYSKRTLDEAVQLLDVYASSGSAFVHAADDLIGRRGGAVFDLALAAWQKVDLCGDFKTEALEAAQRLREGWRP
jgi:hypothetical protein